MPEYPRLAEDDARLAVDIAALELVQSADNNASDEGLEFLLARTGAAIDRYDAVLSQGERQRPFRSRYEDEARQRAERVRSLPLSIVGYLDELVAIEVLP